MKFFTEDASGDIHLMARWKMEGNSQAANIKILNADRYRFQKEIQVILYLDKMTSITIINADDWKVAHLAWIRELGWVF